MLADQIASRVELTGRQGVRQPSVKLARFAVLCLLILMVVAPLINDSTDTSGGGNILRQLSYSVVFIMVAVAARASQHPLRLMAIPLSMTLVLAWCWLSLTWAIDPNIAVRRLILTTLLIWTIFIAVQQVGFDDTVATIRVLAIPVIFANYCAVFFSPSFGIHQMKDLSDPSIVGAWRGILMQKTMQGRFARSQSSFTSLTIGRLSVGFVGA